MKKCPAFFAKAACVLFIMHAGKTYAGLGQRGESLSRCGPALVSLQQAFCLK